MNTRFVRFAAALALVALTAIPTFAAARGTADFTRFYALGDSYGAGFESGALNSNHQPFGWPAIIAKQAGLKICAANASATDNCFAIPFISPNGLGSSGEMYLTDIVSYPPGIVTPAPNGQPLMLSFARPYNNLAVPGYTVGAAMTLTGKEANSGLGQVILRGLGSEVDQALSQKPTFIAVWLGGNDFLGSVTQGTSLGMTSTADFTTQYNALLDKLVAGAPTAGMVVGTLPASFSGVPFVNTVSRFIIDPAKRQPVLGPDGNPIAMIADLGGGTIGQIPAGSYVTLAASSLMASGYGIPPTLALIPPFNQLPNAGKPLPASVVITPTEASAIAAQIADYNSVIKAAAASRNIPVADITGLFNRVGAKQEFVGPFSITGDYITGGFFSLDGIHLTDLGYILFANEYIKAINNAYGTEIPVASVAQLMTNNAMNSGLPFFGTNSIDFFFTSESSSTVLLNLFAMPQVPTAPRRYRASGH